MNKYAHPIDSASVARGPSLLGLCLSIVLAFGLLALLLSLSAVR